MTQNDRCAYLSEQFGIYLKKLYKILFWKQQEKNKVFASTDAAVQKLIARRARRYVKNFCYKHEILVGRFTFKKRVSSNVPKTAHDPTKGDFAAAGIARIVFSIQNTWASARLCGTQEAPPHQFHFATFSHPAGLRPSAPPALLSISVKFGFRKFDLVNFLFIRSVNNKKMF